MWENIVVAFTNFTIFYPIVVTLNNNDVITCICICFVGIFSFLSHLIENHKHGMPGIGLSQQLSYIANRLDVLGVILVCTRVAYIYYTIIGISINPFLGNVALTMALIISTICNLLSEKVFYREKEKYEYMLFHCIWHLSIFLILGKFYKIIVY